LGELEHQALDHDREHDRGTTQVQDQKSRVLLECFDELAGAAVTFGRKEQKLHHPYFLLPTGCPKCLESVDAFARWPSCLSFGAL
jgi:hypothetical protein